VRGALDLLAGRYPAFVFGGRVAGLLPVFHFHEATPASLEPAFAYLAENGYRTVVSDDVSAFVRHGQALPDRAVMLAFDDAWASLWLVVGPLLRKYNLRAVTYAIPSRLHDAESLRPTLDDGPVDAEAADAAENPFVTWPELLTLSQSGLVDVQSHTWSHSTIFTDATVTSHVTADFAAAPLLERPRLNVGAPPEFMQGDAIGTALLPRRSRMSDGLRFLPDPGVLDVTTSSGAVPLGSRVAGRMETADEQRVAIEEEIAQGREVLESRLRLRVRHICLPWGVSGDVTKAALQRLDVQTAFANRFRGRFAVAPGDDPFTLKRLNSRHLFALPGRGRRTLNPFA
jgi:peptidoglycan/xylan/chitin deacetylase (PgdA/CDA1 family)